MHTHKYVYLYNLSNPKPPTKISNCTAKKNLIRLTQRSNIHLIIARVVQQQPSKLQNTFSGNNTAQLIYRSNNRECRPLRMFLPCAIRNNENFYYMWSTMCVNTPQILNLLPDINNNYYKEIWKLYLFNNTKIYV